MRCKLLTAAVVALVMLSAGCSTLEKVVYRPDINQGNFLTPTDVAKLQNGMSKQQVVYLLGTPLVQDPFGSDTWFYIFRQQPGHEGVSQQTVTLKFDSGGTLTSIDNDTSKMVSQNAEPEQNEPQRVQDEPKLIQDELELEPKLEQEQEQELYPPLEEPENEKSSFFDFFDWF